MILGSIILYFLLIDLGISIPILYENRRIEKDISERKQNIKTLTFAISKVFDKLFYNQIDRSKPISTNKKINNNLLRKNIF